MKKWITLIISASALGLLAYSTNWMAALAVFLMMWMDNIDNGKY